MFCLEIEYYFISFNSTITAAFNSFTNYSVPAFYSFTSYSSFNFAFEVVVSFVVIDILAFAQVVNRSVKIVNVGSKSYNFYNPLKQSFLFVNSQKSIGNWVS